MGVLATINYSKTEAPRGGGLYFRAGSYEAEIVGVKDIITQNNEEMFILETKLLESNTDALPAGTRPAWTQKFQGKAAQVAPQNMKMLWCAIMNLNIFDPKDAKFIEAIQEADWKAFASEAISDAQPLAGCRVHIEAVDTKSREGKAFTKVSFTPPKDPTEFQIAMRKEATK
jgi:hypothetical protein